MTERPDGTPVYMVCDPVPEIPEIPFPAGFGMRLMTEADIPAWVDIEQDADPYLTVTEETFRRAFGPDLTEAWMRCYLITDPAGRGVGVITAWGDNCFQGKPFGRLHWLAIRPAYQGRGLAKAASAVVMQRLKKEFGRIYLDTQSKRTAAIRLYESFGFRIIPTPQPTCGYEK